MAPTDSLLLIAAGPRRHTPALQRAFDLAARSGAPVHVVLPAHEPLVDRAASLVHPEVRRLARHQYLDERRDWLDTLAARWTADGLRVTTEALWAPVAHEAILAAVLQRKPALVIKDVGHEVPLHRVLYTALDWKLLRYCPAPLLLVHERSSRLPRRVLAAVDTSPGEPAARSLNARVLEAAARQARVAGAEVHVAHVFPYLPLGAPPYTAMERIYGVARDADREAFAAFAAAAQVPEGRRRWLEGNPARQLAGLVGPAEIDLLVLGSAYRSAIDRLFLGSTAEELLAAAPCDVLLVKPDGFESELARHLDLPALVRRAAQAAAEPAADAADAA
jgi:universal stress protein E